jgi:hypothetical protein
LKRKANIIAAKLVLINTKTGRAAVIVAVAAKKRLSESNEFSGLDQELPATQNPNLRTQFIL